MSSKTRFLIIAGVAVLYVLCAKLGLAMAFRAAQVTAVWPPTAFALIAVWRFGRPAAIGVFLGALIANATTAEPLLVATGIAIGNTLEALTGAWLLRRGSFDGKLARVRDVITLLFALVAAPIVSASIGVASLTTGGVQPVSSAPELWWIWWTGDALGGLIFSPILCHPELREGPGRWLEAPLLLIGTVAASMFVFLRSDAVLAAEYLVFPFLIWAALRFGPAGAAATAVAANVVAVIGTHGGTGPFAGAGPEHGLVLLQIFMAVAATTSLLLGAIAAQNSKAQQRAELSERRLLMAMGGARISAWELDPGSESHEAYRRRIHPADRARVDAAIADAVENRSPFEAEFRLAENDHWINARGTTVDGGRMIGVDIDVTRQKELEEALRLQDRRKDEFLAMLAHELRNPLAPIVHATNLLGTPDSKEARDVIRRQSLHLARLVDDLLDVSRITSGNVLLDRRAITLSEVVSGAIGMWRHYTDEKKLHVTVDIAEHPVWLDADPVRLTQIISNLIHNAAKFTPHGGRIDIVAGEEGGAAFVRVRDSGQGMNEDVLEHAFELFVQGPPPLDRPHGGLGLGLTLVKRLIELHGGSVEAHSEGAGHGSEFRVRLPIASPPPLAAPETLLSAEHRTRRVLLVEDHADARRILALMLSRSGHDVRTAEDGPEALAEAERFAPEVVLLDIGLPGMDGYAVARQLRRMPQCDGARLIALTGYGQAEDREQSRAAGFDEHLLKPVEPANLLAILQS